MSQNRRHEGQELSRPVRHILGLLLVLGIAGFLLYVAGCGGDHNDNGAANGTTSTIQGRVSQVMTAMQTPQQPRSQLAQLQKFLTLVGTAHAQATGSIAGITIQAQINGATIATTVTNNAGEFTLNTSSGNIVLVFVTANFTVSLTVTANEGMVLNLVVTLEPTEVVVEEEEETHGPIRCTGNEVVTLTPETEGSELVIDGLGEACIRAEGRCSINTTGVVDLHLTNCEQCIRAEGTSEINIVADGSVLCEASEDGVRAAGTPLVTIDALGDVTLDVHEVGIRADGNATVEIKGENCSVTGTAEATLVRGNATLSGCFVE